MNCVVELKKSNKPLRKYIFFFGRREIFRRYQQFGYASSYLNVGEKLMCCDGNVLKLTFVTDKA